MPARAGSVNGCRNSSAVASDTSRVKVNGLTGRLVSYASIKSCALCGRSILPYVNGNDAFSAIDTLSTILKGRVYSNRSPSEVTKEKILRYGLSSCRLIARAIGHSHGSARVAPIMSSAFTLIASDFIWSLAPATVLLSRFWD